MFTFFKKDPLQKLESLRSKKLEEAMHLQRSGDLRLYADKIVEISKIERQMDGLKASDARLASVKKVSDASRVSDTLTGTAKEVSDTSQSSTKKASDTSLASVKKVSDAAQASDTSPSQTSDAT